MKQSLPPIAVTAPTDALPSSRRKAEPPVCVIHELRDLITGTYHRVPPSKAEVRIGRVPQQNDISLPHACVSAHHVTCHPHADHLHVYDARSRNGLFVGGASRTETRFFPGDTMHLSDAGVLALTASMGADARALDRLIGSVTVVNDALQLPRLHRCLVFSGPIGACLDQVIAAAHGAATEYRTPLVTRSLASTRQGRRRPRVPRNWPTTPEELDALLSEVADGWLAIDMTDTEDDDRNSLTELFLRRLFSAGATLAISHRPKFPTPGILNEFSPKHIKVPPIRVRLQDPAARATNVEGLVTSIFEAAKIPLPFESLHKDVVAAIGSAAWRRNYEQLWDVLVYSGCLRTRRKPAPHLLTSPTNAIRWIEKLGPDRVLWGLKPRRARPRAGRARAQRQRRR